MPRLEVIRLGADSPANALQARFELPNDDHRTQDRSLFGSDCSTAAVDNPVRSQGDETESGCRINGREQNGQSMSMTTAP